MRLAPPCCWAAAGARPPTPAKAHFSFLFFKKRILSEYRDCGDPKNFTRTPSHNTITTLGTELARTGTNQVPWSTWSAVAGQGGTKKEFYEQKRISRLKGLARFASPLGLAGVEIALPGASEPQAPSIRGERPAGCLGGGHPTAACCAFWPNRKAMQRHSHGACLRRLRSTQSGGRCSLPACPWCC